MWKALFIAVVYYPLTLCHPFRSPLTLSLPPDLLFVFCTSSQSAHSFLLSQSIWRYTAHHFLCFLLDPLLACVEPVCTTVSVKRLSNMTLVLNVRRTYGRITAVGISFTNPIHLYTHLLHVNLYTPPIPFAPLPDSKTIKCVVIKSLPAILLYCFEWMECWSCTKYIKIHQTRSDY